MSSRNTAPRQRSRRRWLLYGALCVLALLALVVTLGLWVIQTLPVTALTQIGRLTNTQLEMQSCVIDLDGSVNIQDLVVYPRDPNLPRVMKAATVYAKFDRRSLLRLRPSLKEIVVRGFVFDARYNLDTGRWNIGSLRINAPPGKGGQMPVVSLEEGTLQYSTIAQAKARAEIITSVPVDARFRLDEKTDRGYHFEVKTGRIKDKLGDSKLDVFWEPGVLTLAGGIASSSGPALDRSVSIYKMAAELEYDSDQDFQLDLRITDLYSSPVDQNDTLKLVFPGRENPLAGLQEFFYRYRPSGKIDVQMEAQGNLADLASSHIGGLIECKDLKVCDRRFNYPLDHLNGSISFSNNTIDSNGLTARHQDVPLHIEFSLLGRGPDSQYKLRVTSEKMRLDEDLYRALNERTQRAWRQVDPQGYVAIDYQRIRPSPPGRQRKLSVDLLDTFATYRGFPYPLKNLTGHIEFGEDHITLTDVVSQTESMSVQLNGVIRNYGTSHPEHDLRVTATSLPLDNTLGQALSPQQRSAYKALQIKGATHANVSIRTDPNSAKPASVYTTLSFQDASILAPGIQTPFEHIYGRAELSARSIALQDLEGQYLGNPVRMSGRITLNREAKPKAFSLDISSDSMRVDDFITALPQKAAQAIAKLQARGKIALRAQLSRGDPNEPIKYQADVDCLSNSMRFERFPYPFRDITGKLIVNNKQCLVQGINAFPDTAAPASAPVGALFVNGQIAYPEGTIHTGSFQVSGENLPFDGTLAQALPENVRGPFAQLRPSGQFKLSPTDIRFSVGADGVLYVDYVTNVHLQDASLKLSEVEAKLRGSLEATGHLESPTGMRRGFIVVSLNSLAVNHKEITDLHTVLTYDPTLRTWRSSDLRGKLYGGKILGQFSLQGTASEPALCKMQIGVANMNLQDFLQASADKDAPVKKQTSGTANGTISFSTTLGSRASRMGRCTFHVTDMQAGKVSPLAKLLSSLGRTESHDHAFERLQVDSYIRDEVLFIETLDIAGNAIALQGSGNLHLPTGQLNLAMIARGQRGKRISVNEPSVLQSLTEGLMGAVVQVEFTGHFSNPEFTTRALPLLENSFKLLGTPRD